MKTKNKIFKMCSSHKKMAFSLSAILMIGLVAAGWAIFYEADPSGFYITSEEPIVFTNDFSMTNVDTTNSSVSKTEYLTIYNVDGEREMVVNLNTTYTDDPSDTCIVNEFDYNVTIKYGINEISDGDTLIVPHGQSAIGIVTFIERDSCAGNLVTELILEG